MDSVLEKDLNIAVSDNVFSWDELQNTTVLITGATGFIGSMLVRTLIAANITRGTKVKIIAIGRNIEKAKFLITSRDIKFVCQDIRTPLNIDDKVDFIFHCAAMTRSLDMVNNPVDVALTMVDGTKNLLGFALRKQVKSFVYLSSMEVYGQISGEVDESSLGQLDLRSPRSCYPESKRMCEMLCNSYFAQYGIPVKIARLSQTFGAGTPKDDTRVFAQFARSVLSGKDIVLHTNGLSRGNYCDTSDCIRALLLLLVEGVSGESYNVANCHASTTIKEMAELVSKEIAAGSIKVVIHKSINLHKLGYAPHADFFLNTDKIQLLGFRPRYNLREMYQKLINDWRMREDA